MNKSRLVIFPILLLLACIPKKKVDAIYKDYAHDAVPYKLYAPDKKIKLHWDLEEISGLTYYKNGLLGAVEDERGKVYFIDAESGEVTRKIKFGKSGDYEGIEFDKNQAWVMKSNGDFFSFEISDADKVTAKKFDSPFRSENDLEGLGMMNGRLLVACKQKGSTDKFQQKGKGIYLWNDDGFGPYLFTPLKDLQQFVKNKEHFNKIKDFDPSAIAVHPMTKDVYILSADHILTIFDTNKTLKEVIKLSPGLYTQPEGICFSPTGTLYLSSEGDGDRGKLFVFRPLPKAK